MKKFFVAMFFSILLIFLYEIFYLTRVDQKIGRHYNSHIDEILSEIKRVKNKKIILFIGNSHVQTGVDAVQIEQNLNQKEVRVFNLVTGELNPVEILLKLYDERIRPHLLIVDVSFKNNFNKKRDLSQVVQKSQKNLFENHFSSLLRNGIHTLSYQNRFQRELSHWIFSISPSFFENYFNLRPSLYQAVSLVQDQGENLKVTIRTPLGNQFYLEKFHHMICEPEIKNLQNLMNRHSRKEKSDYIELLKKMISEKWPIGLIRMPVHPCLNQSEQAIFSSQLSAFQSLVSKGALFYQDYNPLDKASWFYDSDHLDMNGARLFAKEVANTLQKHL